MKNDQTILPTIFFGLFGYMWFFTMVIGIPAGFAGNHELFFAVSTAFGCMCISLVLLIVYMMMTVSLLITRAILEPEREESKKFYENLYYVLSDCMIDSMKEHKYTSKPSAESQSDS